MKQGQATHSGSAGVKREPFAHKQSLTAVSRIGNLVGNHATDNGKVLSNVTPPINGQRGFTAPHDASVNHHPSGSQGRHK